VAEIQSGGFTEFELRALADQASAASDRFRAVARPDLPPSASEEEQRQAREEEARREADEKRQQEEALQKFRTALDDRIVAAYRAGAAAAIDKAERNAWNARSITLYLVVLAVVAMPAVAMLTSLDPQAFGSYIAPVTGIAGTVVGYWFGTLGRPAERGSQNQPKP